MNGVNRKTRARTVWSYWPLKLRNPTLNFHHVASSLADISGADAFIMLARLKAAVKVLTKDFPELESILSSGIV